MLLNDDSSTYRRLEKKGFTSVEEIAEYVPRKYYDFRNVTPREEMEVGQLAVLYGTITQTRMNGKANMLIVKSDDGLVFHITWFNTDYFFQRFTVGMKAYFAGRLSVYQNTWTICNPILSGDKDHVLRILPVYRKISGISDDSLHKSIKEAVGDLKSGRCELDKDLFATQIGLPDYFPALEQAHHPTSPEKLQAARARLAYERIYAFYNELQNAERYPLSQTVGPIQSFQKADELIHNLPFSLTSGQEDVFMKIKERCVKGQRLHAIVSGDVGCGKTLVALLSALLMTENGLQTVIAAPTLILANQHYDEMRKLSESIYINGHPVRFALLTGQTKKRERSQILKSLEEGSIDILIGTHAVFSEDLAFARLGMTIIDEEHKFGVRQKQTLESFEKAGAHHIAMTATPIPRSIAISIYGPGIEALAIESMPQGRKPIETKQVSSPECAIDFLRTEIEKGHQAYVVCPFIEASENERFKDIISVGAAREILEQYTNENPSFRPRVASISGDMKDEKIVETIDAFSAGNIDILISTTIVEVGVNIPNATVICIMSANHFGLAALHQLRGRVGRGNDQGYCVLCCNKRDEKLDILCQTNNGFEIAEKDLELRGPGNIAGLEQSGSNEIMSLILSRPKLSKKVKEHFFPESDEMVGQCS